MATLTGYTMLNLDLKYFAGDMIMNSYMLGLGDLVAKLVAGGVFLLTDLKTLHHICFGFGTFGSLLMTIFYRHGSLTPVLLFLTRSGICMGWVAVQFNFILLFPTVLKSSASGIAWFFAGSSGIVAPFLAELEQPHNLLVLFSIMTTALIASCFMIDNKS